MYPNIGRVNALVRITVGLTTLAWSSARMVKRPNHPCLIMTAMAGAMKTAEGITRFCPMTYFLERNDYGFYDEYADEECEHCEHDEEQSKPFM